MRVHFYCREASLAAAEQSHAAQMSALSVEIKELKTERESQKELYYNTISAVNDQVRVACVACACVFACAASILPTYLH